jgi:hypothetical protein
MKRWSKLQKEIYDLISPDIKFQIHCAVYPMRSQRGSTDLPRYWITLGKEIIWDYPKDFVTSEGTIGNNEGVSLHYPYETDVSDISQLIREYIDTPKDALFDKNFENDKWGLTNILKSADRRIGIRRLNNLKRITHNIAASKVITYRMENKKKTDE